MNYINKRFAEPSTWLGLLSVACMFSKQLFDFEFNDQQISAIQDLGIILAGGAGIAAKDGN
ncbi:MAG: hypothetical protein ACOYM1_12165 [Methylovulum sp.]|jgi:hypothetical protein